jgi:hypothetical protein
MHGSGNNPLELDICTSGSCAAVYFGFCGGDYITAGNTYSLGVHGNVLTCYINGVVAAYGAYTDASNTYTSGYTGFVLIDHSGSIKMGSFTAAAN